MGKEGWKGAPAGPANEQSIAAEKPPFRRRKAAGRRCWRRMATRYREPSARRYREPAGAPPFSCRRGQMWAQFGLPHLSVPRPFRLDLCLGLHGGGGRRGTESHRQTTRAVAKLPLRSSVGASERSEEKEWPLYIESGITLLRTPSSSYCLWHTNKLIPYV